MDTKSYFNSLIFLKRMTNKRLELVKRSLENALILMDDVKPPINASDKAMLMMLKSYSEAILRQINDLLEKN